MTFILKHEVTFTTEKITYGKNVCDIKLDIVKKNYNRLTVGENLMEYYGVLSTPTVTVTTTKCLLK